MPDDDPPKPPSVSPTPIVPPGSSGAPVTPGTAGAPPGPFAFSSLAGTGIPIGTVAPTPTTFSTVQVHLQQPPSQPDIYSKMNEAHLTQFLSNADKRNWREWVDGLVDRGQRAAITVIVLGIASAVVFVSIYMGKDDLAKITLSLGIGFAGGYGLGTNARLKKGKTKEKENDPD